MKIHITEDGKISRDGRGLEYRILDVLCEEPLTLTELIKKVIEHNVEYRNVLLSVYCEKIVSLIKAGWVKCEDEND